MINPFVPGDTKEYTKTVQPDETARFESGEVHPFYGTFALGRDAEWSSRLFVLDMKEDDEEGIGTYLTVKHISPATIGDEVRFVATLEKVEGNAVDCTFEAFVGDRKIAEGTTGQRILKHTQLDKIKASIGGKG